jgi:hypothetical protein
MWRNSAEIGKNRFRHLVKDLEGFRDLFELVSFISCEAIIVKNSGSQWYCVGINPS